MKVLLACLILCVTACRDQRPPSPTAEQNQQLNDADAMLNDMANEEGPADRSTGPSNNSD